MCLYRCMRDTLHEERAKVRRRACASSALGQFCQIDFERNSWHTNLPAFENLRVKFPNHTDLFPFRHNTPHSSSEK